MIILKLLRYDAVLYTRNIAEDGSPVDGLDVAEFRGAKTGRDIRRIPWSRPS